MLYRLAMFAILAALTCGSTFARADDRAPTDDERSRIEATLRGSGFVSWEEIEFDDGRWEVDDARGQDGREYDLKLDPATFEIVSRKEDD
jgi:hypothetical protein